MLRFFCLVCVVLVAWTAPEAVRACDTAYVVRPGDSLSAIARSQLRNAFRWTEIYRDNQATIGPDPDRILVGDTLRLPCKPDQAVSAEQDSETIEGDVPTDAPSDPEDFAEIVLRTGEDLPPFVQGDVPAEGFMVALMQEIVQTSVREADVSVTAMPWSRVMDATAVDARSWAFPVYKAECAKKPARCDEWLYSAPVIELVVSLYSSADAPVLSARQEDLQSLRLCRPANLVAQVSDSDWLAWTNGASLQQVIAPTAQQCFEALSAGQVAAVAVNTLTGNALVASMTLEKAVHLTGLPLAITTLHVAVSRSGPEAFNDIGHINREIDRLRRTGRFQKLLAQYLAQAGAGL